MLRIIMKIMNSSSYLRALPIITQNSFTSSPTRTNQPTCPLKKIYDIIKIQISKKITV